MLLSKLLPNLINSRCLKFVLRKFSQSQGDGFTKETGRGDLDEAIVKPRAEKFKITDDLANLQEFIKGNRGSIRSRFNVHQRSLSNKSKVLTNPYVDGLTRYDIDLLEDVNWVKHMLLSMKRLSEGTTDVIVNENHDKYARRDNPLCFERTKTFVYDFSKLPQKDKEVKVYVRIDKLNLTEPEKHKLRVIAGKYYNMDTDTIDLKSEYDFGNFPKEGKFEHSDTNKIVLTNAISDMISDAKNNPDSISDIPVGVGDLSARPAFPVKPPRRKPIHRRQRLLMLHGRTKQKFEYNTNTKKYNFSL